MNLLNKIKISYYTYIMLILGLMCGLFRDLLIIFFLVLFHEFGHYILAKHFKWNIRKIIIYPFGGFTKYDDIIDKPLIEEAIVAISGPIFQTIFYLFLLLLHKNYMINTNDYLIVRKYHYSMLFFNLLPIIPLDGSKIFNILLNKVLNFRSSYYITLIFSCFLFIILVYIFKDDKSTIFIFSFIVYEIYNAYKNKNFLFNRFIYEKYLIRNSFKKYKYINNIKKMFRNKKNFIKYNDIYISEKNYIKKRSFK